MLALLWARAKEAWNSLVHSAAPYAGDAVGGHAHAYAGSAHENAEGVFILEDGFRDGLGLQRVIAARGIGGAEIVHVVSLILQVTHKKGFKVEAPVIGRDVNGAHDFLQ